MNELAHYVMRQEIKTQTVYTQEYVDMLNSRHADQVRDLKEHIGWLEAKNKSLRKQNTALRKEIKSWYKAVDSI